MFDSGDDEAKVAAGSMLLHFVPENRDLFLGKGLLMILVRPLSSKNMAVREVAMQLMLQLNPGENPEKFHGLVEPLVRNLDDPGFMIDSTKALKYLSNNGF
jgi:hypothetical protein